MNHRCLLAMAGFLILPFAAIADVPFPPALQELIRTISTASLIPIDSAQEIAFDQRLHRPAAKAELTAEERETQYRQSVQDEEDFIATQAKNPVALTNEQTAELITLLLDGQNYYNGLFNVGERKICALDERSADFRFTVVLGSSIVTVLIKGEKTNALLNARGCERMLAWMKSVGVVKA